MPVIAQKKIYTVSQITQDIKTILENSYESLFIEGEVSNLKRPTSGHIYFTLKDESAQIKCVFFRSSNLNLKFELKDGIKVICSGKISVYEKEGQYQLYVRTIEPKGIGALQLAFEQLKEKLEKKGYFESARKKPLPILPRSIGIVTSPTGAAIRDMINILRRRAPFVNIIIRPVKVQGDGAAEEIAQGIQEFNEYAKVDVIIIGRGGGSLEDLWAFNEEAVANAIYASCIPIISAVGHQIDYTISDFVADVRAATPSEAAEIVVKKKEELVSSLEDVLTRIREYIQDKIQELSQSIDEHKTSLDYNIGHLLEINQERLKGLYAKLSLLNPAVWIKREIQQLMHLRTRLCQKIGYYISINKQRFKSTVERMEALSPLKVLSRGYSISLDMSNKAILDAKQIKVNDDIKTILKKGSFISRVLEIESEDKDGTGETGKI